MTLSPEQLDILVHTSRTGRYVSDECAPLVELVNGGLLFDYGPQKLAGGMHYFTLTTAGSEALAAHRATLPKPKPLTRAQRRYREFLSSGGIHGRFGDWLKHRMYSA
jgi:hypothetical protein